MTNIGKKTSISSTLYSKLSRADPKIQTSTESTSIATKTKNGAGNKPLTDGFDVPKANPPLEMTGLAVAQKNKALDGFTNTFNSMFSPSAKQLAAGTKAADPKNLTPAQKDKLTGATQDVLMEMPIATLAPEVGAKLKTFLQSKGMDVKDFEGKRLKDLGKYGGEFAKQFISNMRSNNPGTFYGIAATAATAVGVLGFTKGSAAIEKLGIKPEYKTQFFNKSLEVRAKASWGAKFKDPGLDLNTAYKFDNGTRLSSGISTKVIDDKRITNFSLASSGQLSSNWAGSASASYDTNKNYSLKGNLNYKNGDWTGQVGSAYDNKNGYAGNVGAQYNPNKNFSLNISASHSQKTGSKAFVGLGWKF